MSSATIQFYLSEKRFPLVFPSGFLGKTILKVPISFLWEGTNSLDASMATFGPAAPGQEPVGVTVAGFCISRFYLRYASFAIYCLFLF